MRTACPEFWAGPGTVRHWRGHIRCMATGSGSWHLHPWHMFPSGAKGLTPGSWWAPDRQGPSKQLVTITNSSKEQWMQLFTRAQSKSLLVSCYYACLRSLFYFAGQHGEAVTRAGQQSAGHFHTTQGNPAMLSLHQACRMPCCRLFSTNFPFSWMLKNEASDKCRQTLGSFMQVQMLKKVKICYF